MNKRTFLLVHPEISRTRYNFKGVIENECLDLEHIMAVLKAEGHEVQIWDGQVEERAYTKALKKYEPDVVIVTGRCRQENFMLEYCEKAKAWRASTVTIITGLHAQICYERMYRDYVDYILTSYNIFEILPVIEAEGNIEAYATFEGLCYRDADGVWQHNEAEAFDINRLPMPDRSYFYAHPQNYRYLELTHAAWVRTAYSCPYHCRFCHRNMMNHSTYSPRDIELVVEEIASIPDQNIYIVDDDFLFDSDRLMKFVRLIRERDIHKTYICYGRADFIASHYELMVELKSIGFYYVLVGVEAISDTVLADYHKRTTRETNLKAIEICHKLDLHMMAMFILDLDFRPKDFRMLYQFICENKLRHVATSIYTPELGLPTSDAYANRLITDNPSHYDYLHLVCKPTHMSVRSYYREYYNLLIRLFLRAKHQGVYDFIDYGDYVKSFIHNIFAKREHDDA